MLLTESGSNSSVTCCFSQQVCPVFTPTCRGQRQFGPFRALCGHDARPLAVRQPLQVVTRGHHRHRKVGTRLTNGADQLAAHLFNRPKRMFNTGSCLRNAMVPSLLSVGQRLVPMALALNPVPVAIRFQPSLSLFGRIAPVGIDISAGVGRVHDRVKVLAVMRAGRVGDDLADELVRLVDVHRELVAMVALAMLLGPGRIQILLAPLGRRPVGGHHVRFELFLVILGEVLPGRGYQRGVNDLATSGDETLLEQLCGDAIEDGLGAGFANPVLKRPHCGPVRNVGGLGQPTEALVAHPVQQLVLHLLVRQVVQALQDQNAYHGFSGERWPATLEADRARSNVVDVCRQSHEVDTGLDLGKRVAQLVEGLLVMPVGKQVSLDGAALLHGGQVRMKSDDGNFTPARAGWMFFEVPKRNSWVTGVMHRLAKSYCIANFTRHPSRSSGERGLQ